MMRSRLLCVSLCFPLLLGTAWQAGSCSGSAGNSTPHNASRNSAPAASRTSNSNGAEGAQGAVPVNGQAQATANATKDSKKEMSNDNREKAGRVADGNWGGNQVRLDVRQGGADIEFDCAHGTLDAALETDARGRFDVRGSFVRERGGPVRLNEKPDSTPARYSGSVAGDEMTLTVTLENSDESVGTFTLRRGSEGRLRKCR